MPGSRGISVPMRRRILLHYNSIPQRTRPGLVDSLLIFKKHSEIRLKKIKSSIVHSNPVCQPLLKSCTSRRGVVTIEMNIVSTDMSMVAYFLLYVNPNTTKMLSTLQYWECSWQTPQYIRCMAGFITSFVSLSVHPKWHPVSLIVHYFWPWPL